MKATIFIHFSKIVLLSTLFVGQVFFVHLAHAEPLYVDDSFAPLTITDMWADVAQSMGSVVTDSVAAASQAGDEIRSFFNFVRETIISWFAPRTATTTMIQLVPDTPLPAGTPPTVTQTILQSSPERIIETRTVTNTNSVLGLSETDLATAIAGLRAELLPKIKKAMGSPTYNPPDSAFLELTGGTLSGALSGTTLSLSSGLSVAGTFADSMGSVGTNGFVLQSTATGTTWVATSSLGISSGSVADGSFSTTSADYYINASTTIANASGVTSGNVLQWNGVRWVSVATTTLGIGTSQWVTNASDIYYTTGNVGVGTTSPSQKLEVSGNIFATGSLNAGGSAISSNRYVNVDVSAVDPTGTGALRGGYFNLVGSNGGDADGLVALGGYVTKSSGVFSHGALVGVQGIATLNSGQSADNMSSVSAETAVYGSTNQAYGSLNQVATFAAGASIGSAFGVYSDAVSALGGSISNSYAFYGKTRNLAGGTTVNAYGLYLEPVTAGSSNNYSIYSAGGTNYFASNVGIGTTSPYAKLSVVGPVVAEYFNATSTTATSVFRGGASVGGSQGLNVNSSGFVSIGTASPDGIHNLLVGGYLGDIILGRSPGDDVAYDSSKLSFWTGYDGSPGPAVTDSHVGFDVQAIQESVTTSDSRLAFSINGGPEAMAIRSTGSVGIGTTSPYAKLSVSGDVAITGGLYDNSGSRGQNGYVLQSTGTGFAWVSTTTLGISGGASDHGALTGLLDDDHTQYALLAGRTGGESLLGINALSSATGKPLSLRVTDPVATTGASQVGTTTTVTSGNAVASTNTAGAAAGGAVILQTGNAARFSSGDANGGDINLLLGTGIGATGKGGRINWNGVRFISLPEADSTAYTGSANMYIGYSSGGTSHNDWTKYNTGIGYESMRIYNGGDRNTALGYRSMYNAGGGAGSNTAIGAEALYTFGNGGTGNTAVGRSALYYLPGGINSNTAVGYMAGYATGGYSNTALGASALYSGGGNYNVAVGSNSMINISSGYENIAIGTESVRSVGAGYRNVGIGHEVLYNTSGYGNIAIGYQSAWNNTSGTRNIFIGYNIDPTANNLSNRLNIGNLLFGTGIDGEDTTISSGNIGVGTTTPTARFAVRGRAGTANIFEIASSTDASILTVTGTGLVGIGTTTPWRTFSASGTVAFVGLSTAAGTPDALCLSANKEVTVNTGAQTCTVSSLRFKHDVSAYTDALTTINALNPSVFIYNDTTNERIGLIAEEVALVDDRLIFREADGTPRGVRYEDIVAVLVKAVQELSVKVDQLLAASGSAVSGAVAHFTDIVTGTITSEESKTNTLCIGTTCLTETDIQKILNATNVTPEGVGSAPEPSGNVSTDPIPADTGTGTPDVTPPTEETPLGETGSVAGETTQDVATETETPSPTETSASPDAPASAPEPAV